MIVGVQELEMRTGTKWVGKNVSDKKEHERFLISSESYIDLYIKVLRIKYNISGQY